MQKKIFLLIVIFIILGAFFVASMGFSPINQNYDKTIVYLGDSICEGILGSSPFSERDSYCYYAIIGRRNNFRYMDKSVSGDTVSNMYHKLTRTDTPSLERQYWVSQADIIHISILGNDMLGGNIGQTAIEAYMGDYANINTILTNAREYFALSIERIKQLNPDALILVNTVYNPLDKDTTLLTPTQKNALMELAGGDQTQFRTVGGILLQSLNSVIYDYLEDNPNAFEVIDVYTAFDNEYKKNRESGIALIYGDWLHPSNEGHAVMANLIQEKLEEMNLVNKSQAVSKYRILRIKQLERLFSDTTVDVDAVKKKILIANTCEEISNIFFQSIRNVTPIYTNRPIKWRKGKILKETKTFGLSSIMMGGTEYTSFADKEKSYIKFVDDGSFSLKLTPSVSAYSMVSIALVVATLNGGLDVSDIVNSAGGFGTPIGVYLNGVFPDFDFRDIQKSIGLLTSIGLHINGFDFESEQMKEFTNSMKENLTIPKGFSLPEDISFELKGHYFVEKAGNFTNIYMCVGNVSNNGYPFLYATLHEENDGSSWIETSIEVSKITLVAGK